ncbi:DNA segregation ATPase FtsK/SpoIIIE, S-DNA-T family [Pilibacter termitis]|uniref:DNA translocase FtsK n=1 Tax=Pilibacter termitis TaxID=263852 RepID=A0A1T4KHD9_9ENTE|nr:DNA segregation ATPase FtsK/SpoIIIE, S-DNA-T family [Pilibacter termitis]
MAQRKKKTGRRSSKNSKKQQVQRREILIGLAGILIAIFSGFQLGYLGIQVANIFRIFVGNLFEILCLAVLVFSIYLIISPLFQSKGREKFWTVKRITGATLSFMSILLMNHALMFDSIKTKNPNILSTTWEMLVLDFRHGKVAENVGGGMIGAVEFSLTHFLVATLGSWLIAIVLLCIGICLFFGIGTSELSDWFHTVKEKIEEDPEILAKKEALRTQKQEARQLRKEQKAQAKLEKRSAYYEKRMQELANSQESEPEVEETPIPISTSTPTIMQKEEEILPPQTTELETLTPFSDEPIKQVGLPKVSLSSVKEEVVPVQESLELEVEEETFDPREIPFSDYEGEEGEVLGEREAEEARQQDVAINNLAIQELENPNYKLPQTSLLDPIPPSDQTGEIAIAEENMEKLRKTFESFKVDASIVNAQIGPSVTKFEVKPAIGVAVSRFKKMTDDIQLALGARDLRMEAPIPGKSLIGIEVPNAHISPVSYRDIAEKMKLHKDKYLEVPLGRDIYGGIQTMDLSAMPHVLVAGATGSGKSVAVNGIITSILFHAKPHEVKMVMVDPKMVELSVYNGIPHLLTPVVTNPKKASQALNKVVEEMERRYELFAQFGIRKMESYNAMVDFENAKLGKGAKKYAKMPYIVVIVDEMADLMMVSGKEVEAAIVRLAQKARAAGIHMILATQRPSVDVITGLIKANIPSRMAFAVSSGVDSRTILDQQGAEKLLGRGDMLYYPIGASHPIRVQGAFLSDQEVERVVEFVKTQQEVVYNENFDPGEVSETEGFSGGSSNSEVDPRYEEIKEYVISSGKASKSEWQRVFKMNFNTATVIMDTLEAEGIVGPDEGKKPRRVLVSGVANHSGEVE